MIEKEKRKQAPNRHRRLHLLLLVWTGMMFLVTKYNLWLIPPYFRITSYLYLAAGLGCLYITFRYIRDYGWRKLLIVLVCLNIVVFLILALQFLTMNASECDAKHENEVTFYLCRPHGSCYPSEFVFQKMSNLPIMTLIERNFPFGSALCR